MDRWIRIRMGVYKDTGDKALIGRRVTPIL